LKKIIIVLCIATLALAGCTSKPSKESARESFRSNLIETLGANATDAQKDSITEYADCIVDETYDKLSAKTLKKFVDAKDADAFANVNGTKDEKTALDDAAETCSNKLVDASSS
jgi:hypothetical protein